MQHYTIKTKNTAQTLFKGQYTSFKHCLEDAVKQRINLRQANLHGRNLTNANLDDALLMEADLSHTNLTGANLSESSLQHANFENADLHNTCLSYSNLSAANFHGTTFAATDVNGTIITNARFSTLSCFTLDFTKTKNMQRCTFTDLHGHSSEMSRPPIIINGIGNTPIIILDHDIRAGHNHLNTNKYSAKYPDKMEKIIQRFANREIHKRLKNIENQTHSPQSYLQKRKVN